ETRSGITLSGHILRQPSYVPLAELSQRQRGLSLELYGITAGAPDDAHGEPEKPRALGDFLGDRWRRGQHIPPLILAKPHRVRRQLALVWKQLDAAVTCERHLRHRHQQAAIAHVVDGRHLLLADER